MMYPKSFLLFQVAYMSLTLSLFKPSVAQSTTQNEYDNNNQIVSSHQSQFLRSNNHPNPHRKTQTETITWTFGPYNDLTLGLGTTIEFVNSGAHNLYIMDSESAFDDCDFSGATLVSPQTYTNDGSEEVVYFACRVGAHCSAGDQKIRVIFEEEETESPTVSPTPSPTVTKSPTMSPTSTESPTSSANPTDAPSESPSMSPITETVEWSLRSYDPIILSPGSSIEFINEGTHDLLIMESAEKYENCDFSGATLVDPQTYVNDGTEETIYFACSIGPHCGLGMKVVVVFGDEITDDTDVSSGFSIIGLIFSLLSCIA